MGLRPQVDPAPLTGETDVPTTRPEEGPPREEPVGTTLPDCADEQDQGGPRGHSGRTFTEHARKAMEKHSTLFKLLSELEKRGLESRTQGLPSDLLDRLD